MSIGNKAVANAVNGKVVVDMREFLEFISNQKYFQRWKTIYTKS
jgi:hypothetical protein